VAETLRAGRSCTIGPPRWLAQVLLLGTENRPHRVAACHRASCQGADRAFHRLCVGWLGRDNGASLVFLRSHGAAHPSENAMKESIVHRVQITRHVTTYGSVHYTYGQHDSTEAAEPGVLHFFLLYTVEFLQPGPCGPAHQPVEDIGWQQAHGSLPWYCGSVNKDALAPCMYTRRGRWSWCGLARCSQWWCMGYVCIILFRSGADLASTGCSA
jgi:hypothetical protein